MLSSFLTTSLHSAIVSVLSLVTVSSLSLPPAWAQSQGDVRLVGGNSSSFGRVEVSLQDHWSTIYVTITSLEQPTQSATSWITPSYSTQGTNVREMNKSLREQGAPQIETMPNSTRITLRDVDCGAIYSRPFTSSNVSVHRQGVTIIQLCMYSSVKHWVGPGQACVVHVLFVITAQGIPVGAE